MHAHACTRAHTHTHTCKLLSTGRPQKCLIQSCAEDILSGLRTGVSARGLAGKPARLGFVRKHTQGSHSRPPSQGRGGSRGPWQGPHPQSDPAPGRTTVKPGSSWWNRDPTFCFLTAGPQPVPPSHQPPAGNQGGIGGRKAACGGRRPEAGCWGPSLGVQWLRLRAPSAVGLGSIPGQETKIPPASWSSHNRTERGWVLGQVTLQTAGLRGPPVPRGLALPVGAPSQASPRFPAQHGQVSGASSLPVRAALCFPPWLLYFHRQQLHERPVCSETAASAPFKASPRREAAGGGQEAVDSRGTIWIPAVPPCSISRAHLGKPSPKP